MCGEPRDLPPGPALSQALGDPEPDLVYPGLLTGVRGSHTPYLCVLWICLTLREKEGSWAEGSGMVKGHRLSAPCRDGGLSDSLTHSQEKETLGPSHISSRTEDTSQHAALRGGECRVP